MGLGMWQIILIIIVVLIVFGAGKLPSVMGDVGKGVKNLKKGLKDEGKDDSSDKQNIEKIEKTDK